jgi:Phage derived protein Gp49-like (DUF891)
MNPQANSQSPLKWTEEFYSPLQWTLAVSPHFSRGWVTNGANTLQGSEYPNMKELRFNAMNGVWRVAFAFDPLRRAIILVAGDKSGVSQKRFYQFIKTADRRFTGVAGLGYD